MDFSGEMTVKPFYSNPDGGEKLWLKTNDTKNHMNLYVKDRGYSVCACMCAEDAKRLRDMLVEAYPMTDEAGFRVDHAPQSPTAPHGPQEYKGNGKHKWERVTDSMDRFRVPGGWLYREGSTINFVPLPSVIGYQI